MEVLEFLRGKQINIFGGIKNIVGVKRTITIFCSVDYDAIIEERRLAAEEEERQRKEFELKV